MKYLTFISILITSFILVGCSKDEDKEETVESGPVACFTYSVTGSTVAFSSGCSKEANEYLWDFGNGQVSIAANPVYTYIGSGTHLVTLRVTSKSGATNTISQDVHVGLEKAFCKCINDLNGDVLWTDSINGTVQQVAAWKASLQDCPSPYTLYCN